MITETRYQVQQTDMKQLQQTDSMETTLFWFYMCKRAHRWWVSNF